MLSISRAAAAAAFAVLSVAAVAPPPAKAHEYRAGDLVITHPWTRATPPSARVAGGFMVIENKGTQPDRLLSGSFTRSTKFEVHEMAMENNVMRMRELPKGLEIPPGGKVELRPGGYHVMFIDMTAGLKEGETIKGTLVFERAGRIDVEYKVEAMGARGGGHGHGHGHHGHGAPKTN